jgi:signal transduction histidine kinase
MPVTANAVGPRSSVRDGGSGASRSPSADGFLFSRKARRRALGYWALVTTVLTTAGHFVSGQRPYLLVWLCGAAPLTTPSFFITRRAAAISGPTQRSFFRMWFAGLSLVYLCGCGIWVMAWTSVPVLEALAPISVLSPIAVYSTALALAIRAKSGGRNVSIDVLDCMMSSALITAPVFLLLLGPLTQTSVGWFTLSAALVAAVMPGAIVGTIALFHLLPRGEREAEAICIAMASAAVLNAALQVWQGLVGFTLPAAPLVLVQCLSMGLLFILPFAVRRVEPRGLDRLPVQAQVRSRHFLPVVVAATVPLLVAETLATYADRPWVVPYSLGIFGVLGVVATFRETLAGRETRRLYREIEDLAEQRKQLLADLMHAVEHDRHRMAAQLHEQAVGGLAVLGSVMRASAAVLPRERSAQLDDALRGIRSDMAGQVESLRRLMLAVRPPVLEESSLPTAVSVFATGIFAEGPRVSITVSVDPDLVLDWTTETIVYRVVQEALHNAQRHAMADHVSVVVGAPDDVVEITVADDGIGFEPSEVLYESGISTMRMFAGLDRGVLEITSAPGAGTIVHVTLGVLDEPLHDGPPDRGALHLIVGGADEAAIGDAIDLRAPSDLSTE